jgi:hypothetical protein
MRPDQEATTCFVVAFLLRKKAMTIGNPMVITLDMPITANR